MKKNILIIFDFKKKELRPDGNILRIKHIFSRLNKKNNIIALFINDDKIMTRELPYFDKKYHIHYFLKKSFFRKLIRFLTLNTSFLIKYYSTPSIKNIQRQISTIIKKEKIDIIHTWLIKTSQFVSHIKEVPLLYDLCDAPSLTYLMEKSDFLIKKINFLRIKGIEQRLIRNHYTCFVSKRDVNLLGVRSNKCFVIPNGVDSNYFKPEKCKEEKFSLVFSGNMYFEPNIEAVRYFYNKIFKSLKKKYPYIKWYIVGNNPIDEIKNLHDGKNIIVTGFVEDIRKYISRAEIVICPMISGLGIKNKILEAMAMGKAIVSTKLGTAGIETENDINILTADSPEKFNKNIIKLFKNIKLRKKLGKNARKLILEKYSWENTVDQYNRLYNKIIKDFSNKKL